LDNEVVVVAVVVGVTK